MRGKKKLEQSPDSRPTDLSSTMMQSHFSKNFQGELHTKSSKFSVLISAFAQRMFCFVLTWLEGTIQSNHN